MKLISSFIILGLLITLSYSKCSTKTDSVTIFPTTGEILTWNLVEEFFNGAGLSFSLNDTQQNVFKIIDPIENTGGEQSYSKAATQIISSRGLTSNKYWVNSFAFLNRNSTTISLVTAEGEPGNQRTVPNFKNEIKVDDIKNGLECHDFEYFSQNIFLVDCSITIGQKHYNTIYVVNNGVSKPFQEEALVKQNQGRILGQYKQIGQSGQELRYLVRVTPSYSLSTDGSLSGDSLIEVFILDSQGEPQNTGYVLDGVTMSQLLGVNHDIEFNIVDMKILENGNIYLLDAQYGFYIVSYIPNGTFKLVDWFDHGMGFAYAFDRNLYVRRDGRFSENIVVLGYGFIELIVDRKLTSLYTLPTQLPYTFPANIDLSQEFIVVKQANSTFIFDIDAKSNELLTVQTIPDTKYVLINPYLPDMIVLTLEKAYRYSLSSGYLKYIGPTAAQEQKTIDLVAKTETDECKVTIKYQIIDRKDKQLYQYDDLTTVFPSQVTEDVEPLQLNTLTSGPNEQYEYTDKYTEDETSVSVQINAYWELNFTTPLPKDLKFSDVLIGKQSTYFFMAEQNADGQLNVIKAHHDSIYTSSATKEKYFEFPNIGITLTKTTFQMWECECPKFHFAYVENSKVIMKVYDNDAKVVKDVATIQFETQKISILFLENFLYVLQNNILSAYTEHGEFVKSVDINILKSQGYTGTWNPQQIYGNRKVRENLLFVVHKDHITILDFHTQFTFIKQIQIESSENIELAIGSETFFIVNATSIVEYDHDRLNDIFLTKTIELYNYELVTPLLGDFCSDTGYLFVIAKEKSTPVEMNEDTNKNFILAIQPNTLQHDAIFKAIPVNQPKLISTQGTLEQMYIYVQTAGTSVINVLLTNPVLTIKPSINNPAFATDLNLQLKIFNFEDEKSINFKQTVQVINTQTKIYIDQKSFKNSLTISTDAKVTEYPLGTTWYSGQVSEFSITCEQCGKEKGIQITEIIQPTNEFLLKDYVVKSINGDIVQASNALILLNSNDTLSETIINYDFTTEEYSCFQSTQKSGDYILSLCYDGQTFTVYGVSFLSQTGGFPMGEVLKLTPTVKKIELLENEVLVVLDSDSLIISQINMDEDIWVLDEIHVFNLVQLQITFEDLQTFTPNDFLITPVNSVANAKQYYKLIISSGEGLLITDFYYSDQKPIFVNTEHINLTNELLNLKLYATSTTSYLQIKEITKFTDNTLVIFQQTNNVVHYGLKITFVKKDGQDYVVYSKIEATFILNRYGTWKTVNHVAISNKHVAIPYQNQENIIVTVYLIPENTKPATIIGSYRFTEDVAAFNPMNFGLFFRNEKLYGSTPSTPVQLFQVNSEPSLIITQTKELPVKTQNITVTTKNDFNKVDSTFVLTVQDGPGPGPVPPGPDPDNPSESSNLWWILLVSIGGGLLIIGGVGYMIWRSKQRKDVEDDNYRSM